MVRAAAPRYRAAGAADVALENLRKKGLGRFETVQTQGNTRELTAEDQEIYDELASCLDPIPRHLLCPLRVYAILSEQWERAASNLDGSGGLHQYKLAQMLSYFGSQAERAKATIDKEIDRQRLAREKAAEDRIDEELFVDV